MFDESEYERLAKAGLLPEIPPKRSQDQEDRARTEFYSSQTASGQPESADGSDQSIAVLRSIAETLDRISTDLQSIDTLLSRVMEE